jgi:hypothetical protein
MSDKTQHQEAQELIDWTRTNGDPGWVTNRSVIGLFSVICELQERLDAIERRFSAATNALEEGQTYD